MIIPKNLDPDEMDQVSMGRKSIEDGLYFSVVKEQEDSGWINHTSYRYYKGGNRNPIWIVDIYGTTVYISFLYGSSIHKSANKEQFFEFVKNNSPDAMDWVLFNLESLLCLA